MHWFRVWHLAASVFGQPGSAGTGSKMFTCADMPKVPTTSSCLQSLAGTTSPALSTDSLGCMACACLDLSTAMIVAVYDCAWIGLLG